MPCQCGNHNTPLEVLSPEAVTYTAPAQAEPPLKTLPLDQCIACAQKHCDQAYGALNEYGYTRENRRWLRASLRGIVGHTYRRWPEIADRARALALTIQANEDTPETYERMEELSAMIDDAFYAEYPEALERLERLRENPPARK